MDFSSLLRSALPTLAANASHGTNGSAESGLPDGLLDTLTPLLGFQFNPLMRLLMLLHKVMGTHLGIDPTYILTAVGLLWAANKLWAHLSAVVLSLAHQHFTANVEVSSSDDIYLHMMKWLASQPSMVDSRALTAETASKGAWDEEDEDDDDDFTAARVFDGGVSSSYLNFSNQEAKAPPRFTPALGLHSFWFRGRYFMLNRKQEALFDPSAGVHGGPQFKDKETLVLSCFGRSPDPIKRLLQVAKEQYYHDHQANTIVRRPSGQSMRRFGHRHPWQQVANRPVRPMSTVVLDDDQKMRVLSDINEYLHPATSRWYANRGIPLRRGYLFHGPPGTGKTSLSFALAGVFGLDIYVISLLDPSLTEEDLLGLFTSLPRRCVVLLEDIDTAGLRRTDDVPSDDNDSDADSDDEKPKKQQTDSDKNPPKKPRRSRKDDWRVSDLARELKRQGGSDSGEKKGISLSGLLNAIDGVASHEGRVLIMTTNKPDTLDDALIRPGRVDLQVAFRNATREQARELFVRMYEPENVVHSSVVLTTTAAAAAAAAVVPPSPLLGFERAAVPPSPVPSDKDGNMSDVSGATEVDSSPAPSPPLSPMTTAPLNNGTTTTTTTTTTLPPNPSTKKTPPAPLILTNPPSKTTTNNTHHHHPVQKPPRHHHQSPPDDEPPLSASELAHTAGVFAAQIPGGQFSPAELQGFLLKRKRTPRRAAEEVGAWVAAVVAQRRAGGKVGLEVQ